MNFFPKLFLITKRALTKERMLLQIQHPPKLFFCCICNYYTVLIRTDKSPKIGSRCLTCRSTAHHRGVVSYLREKYGEKLEKLKNGNVYEISAHGALFNFFNKQKKKLNFNFYFSEFLDGWTPGKIYNGIRCENIENLTFEENYFDLITSTGVMEHVENDKKGYEEVFRVLKKGGHYIYVVPLLTTNKFTKQRALRDKNNEIIHLLPEEYHGDPFRGDKGVFTWRNYGTDILDLLRKIGFSAEIIEVHTKETGYYIPVISAKKI